MPSSVSHTASVTASRHVPSPRQHAPTGPNGFGSKRMSPRLFLVPSSCADAPAVSLVVDDVLGLAEDYYRSGDAGMRFLPARARWAILIASRLYRGIGRRLRRADRTNPRAPGRLEVVYRYR